MVLGPGDGPTRVGHLCSRVRLATSTRRYAAWSSPPAFRTPSAQLTHRRARAHTGLHLVSLAQVRLNDSPDSTTALEDATLYVRFARECLQTGTSMRGMRREGRCALADEVGEVERACEARWREYRTGEGLLT